MVGNGVVDINQTNYAWFEAGYTHTLVDGDTWDGMKSECDFTKDLGIDGNGCPRGVSNECAALVNVWMEQSGNKEGKLSLYDYYSDVCLSSTSESERKHQLKQKDRESIKQERINLRRTRE